MESESGVADHPTNVGHICLIPDPSKNAKKLSTERVKNINLSDIEPISLTIELLPKQ